MAIDTADPWLRLEATISAARTIDSLSAEDASGAAARLGNLAAKNANDAHLLVAAAGAARRDSAAFLSSWLDGLRELKADAASGRVGEDLARDRWITAAARQLVSHAEKSQPDQMHEVTARIRFVLTTEDRVSPLAQLAALTALHQMTRSGIATQQAKAKGQPPADQPIDALAVVDRPLWRKVRRPRD